MKTSSLYDISIDSFYAVFLGLSLALVLQTNYRILPDIGLGEVALGLFSLLSVLKFIANVNSEKIFYKYKSILGLFFYVVFLLLPITIVNISEGTPGTSFRDWLAYFLGVSVILGMVVFKIDIKIAVRSTILFTLLLVGIQFLFGADGAWYSLRFTGGAKNPNQLVLYVVCCVLLISVSGFKAYVVLLLLSVVIFFGLRAGSDAFIVYLLSLVFFMGLLLVIPNKYLPYFIIPLSTFFVVVMVDSLIIQKVNLINIWFAADEGGARLILFINGFEAWLYNITSILFGNGAGSYSGYNAPFQKSEAHNTPIDILALGGLVGLCVFYYLPIKNILQAYGYNKKFIFSASIGLIIFSLFHFVSRHPIYWFTLFVVFDYLRVFKKKGLD